ncbi:helix-turn-helix domain-containing protein [Sulfitobacter sp. F26169L]|uniref:IclR family transcriptional regulator n=1 Tax=Sulfitobacter sp. F26169L TaxID=2996015 RepID=UPI002260B10D|nr:helix-turn-helix domain-containing protein [Sulfitobacter sp. F26169L]MCX7568081.1 helix-turn-helix domain-containing protein [Sulfitobacter sp. F26169L]
MIVKQAANVLDLLEYFARNQRIASLAEISHDLGLPRSSAFNLISTLVQRGFLYEPKPRAGFYPTPRWLALANEIAMANPLPEQATNLIEDLAQASGETVWIAAPNGQQAVLLSVIQSTHAIRYTADAGKQVPIHLTASGQATMSQMPAKHIAAILKKATFTRYGDGTPMSVPEVEKNIADGLKRGWFCSASAYSRDLGGVSVPLVMDGSIYSVTVAGPLFRVQDRMPDSARMVHDAIARHFGPDYMRTHMPGLHRLHG